MSSRRKVFNMLQLHLIQKESQFYSLDFNYVLSSVPFKSGLGLFALRVGCCEAYDVSGVACEC